VTDGLAEADEIERTIEQEAVKVRTIRQRILSVDSLDQLHASLNILKSQLLTIKYGLLQSADLSHRIRNYYPLPLSYPYRVLQAEHAKVRVLKQVYRTAEVQIAFLSSLAFVLGPKPEGKTKERVLSSWKGKGATFGTWMGVLSEVASKLDPSASPLHKSLKQLIGTPGKPSRYIASAQWLNEQRDRFHHEDLPEGSELEELVSQALDRLSVCYTELGFVMSCEFLLVLDFNTSRDRKTFKAQCLLYSGDHPACRVVERQSLDPITKDDIYMVVEGLPWYPLFPFILCRFCPRCHVRETYYVDAFGKNVPAKLKSFERGHTETSQEIADALATWIE
jgi:hypothetical protein